MLCRKYVQLQRKCHLREPAWILTIVPSLVARTLGARREKRVHGKCKGFLSCQPANGDPDSVEVAIIFLLQFLSAQLNVGATYLRRSIDCRFTTSTAGPGFPPPFCQRKASGPDNGNTILSVASRLQSVREYLQQSISTIIITIIVPGGRAGAAVTVVTACFSGSVQIFGGNASSANTNKKTKP